MAIFNSYVKLPEGITLWGTTKKGVDDPSINIQPSVRRTSSDPQDLEEHIKGH